MAPKPFDGSGPEAPAVDGGRAEVRPLTTQDLDIVPPPRQRYPVSLRQSLKQLLAARELVLTFAERDLRVRYKQTVLGGVWAILQPVILMVIFSVVFGRIAHVGSEGAPYPVFAYSALVPWGFFAGALTYGTTSLIQSSGIVRKIYLPREIFPLASIVSSGVDFGSSLLILLAMLTAYGYFPRVAWIAYPLLFLVLLLFTVAATLMSAAVTVHFRDVRFVVPTLLQILLFLTPIAYPMGRALDSLSPGLASAYPYLNPLVPVIDGFRRVLVHGRWPDWGPLGVSAAVGGLAVVLAYRAYKRLDASFPDVI